ncbi:hypothetical protein EYZ11_003491 [Aspergillus tanneri]|uniref:Aminotransferase class I/classII large domain-containing protein n=1 Tax=Aspergillus tanneri TaxID=1220188 RepID=A0A4S3JQD4_9EURO|nr:hypothetical protein EYZ11_003491 [Aspergillus tanneri]
MSIGHNILTHKLQALLDNRRHQGRLLYHPLPTTLMGTVDFGSNDTLGLSSSGLLSAAFLRELERHPTFTVGSTSSRAVEGGRQYLLDLEDDLAKFHGAATGLFVHSGYSANVAIWSTLPQPGDFVVYDELVHASIHDGLRQCRATSRAFRHNDCAALKRQLEEIRDQDEGVAHGRQVVFIAIESFYSMDGDMAPLHSIITAAREALPAGNYLVSHPTAHLWQGPGLHGR